MSTSSSLEQYLAEYLTYLEITKNRATPTIENYRFYLRRFLVLMKLHDPSQISEQIITRYRLLLNRWVDPHGQRLAKTTQNYHLVALRAFLKYLARQDVQTLAAEKVELMRLPERQVDFLETSDLEELLAQPLKLKQPAILQRRDRAMLETLFSTGMRVSELVSLKRPQLHSKSEELSIRGKGGRIRVVFLSQQARYWIQEYQSVRRDNSQWLFLRHDRAGKPTVTEEGHALTPRSVQRLIARYAKLAGITKHVTPHTLRHTYATDLLTNGADLRSVQVLLGHASVATTQIYTHVTNRQLRHIHRAFHGRQRRRE